MINYSFSLHEASYCCFTENPLKFLPNCIGLDFFGLGNCLICLIVLAGLLEGKTE